VTASSAPSTSTRNARAAVWPGLLLSATGAAFALAVNHFLPGLSAMLVAILLGALLVNVVGGESGTLPSRFGAGLAFSARRLLRLGVVLLGLQLVLGDILSLGWTVVVGVVAIVGLTMLASIGIGRLLRINDTQALLIATGFSICGAAAVAGAEGVLGKRAKDGEAATAVTLVVIFGTIMIAVMPALTGILGLDQRTAGVWTGGSVHEVAQVVAAAGIIGPAALTVAVVVKLARVLMLAPVMLVLSWREREHSAREGQKLPPLVPLFVAGFVAMVAVRSLGILPGPVLGFAQQAQQWLLAAAMFALGTTVHWQVLRRTGGRPVALAAAATVVIMLLAGAVAFLSR
jgi:uncharacterized integral membrane protein (TIGR00698 family)